MMTLPMKPSMTLGQALDVLAHLQSAAPPSTAALLERVTSLLKDYADENTHLSNIIVESSNKPGQVTVSSTEPSIITDLDLMAGLNEAMRAPLVAVRGRAELIETGLLGQITEEQGRWLRAIQENTDRAFAVLDALQQMISLRNGKVKLDIENFVSADLVWEAFNRVRVKAKSFNHEVKAQLPDVVPMARGDFYQSLMILMDLLDNAIQYTSEGGVIRLSLDDIGSHVLFSVADNGIGLTEEDLRNVGRPFWRGEHHYQVPQYLGTGLRLYLARQILTLQQGELIFSGEPDVGSTFSITLPKAT